MEPLLAGIRGRFSVRIRKIVVSNVNYIGKVERLNERSLEDYLGGQRATAIYIVGGWDCLSFNRKGEAKPW
jgi:hypothetical protein